MPKNKRLGMISVCVLALTIMGVTGCATGGQPPAGEKASPINQSDTNTTSLATSSSTPNRRASKTSTSNVTISVSSSNHKSQSGSGVHDSPKAPWNFVVVQSMARVMKNTSAPLVAPTYIGQSNNSNFPYLTSLTTSTSDEYRVAFHLTSTQVGVDSPDINQPPNTGLAEYVGGFAVTQFPSTQNVSLTLKQFVLPMSPQAVQHSVDLGNGIVGKTLSFNGETMSQWYEGKWRCQVVGSSAVDVLQESRQIVEYLHRGC